MQLFATLVSLAILSGSAVATTGLKIDKNALDHHYWFYSDVQTLTHPKTFDPLSKVAKDTHDFDSWIIGLARDYLKDMHPKFEAERTAYVAKMSALDKLNKPIRDSNKAAEAKAKADKKTAPKLKELHAIYKQPKAAPNVMTLIIHKETVQASSSVRRSTPQDVQVHVKDKQLLDEISKVDGEDSLLLQGLKGCEEDYTGDDDSKHKNQASCGEMMGLHLLSKRLGSLKLATLEGVIVTVYEFKGEVSILDPCSTNAAENPARPYGCTQVLSHAPHVRLIEKIAMPATTVKPAGFSLAPAAGQFSIFPPAKSPVLKRGQMNVVGKIFSA